MGPFGFRNKNSTIDQNHRITHTIEKAYEENQTYSAIQTGRIIFTRKYIYRGVSQVRLLYILYNYVISQTEHNMTIATYAKDTAIVAVVHANEDK